MESCLFVCLFVQCVELSREKIEFCVGFFCKREKYDFFSIKIKRLMIDKFLLLLLLLLFNFVEHNSARTNLNQIMKGINEATNENAGIFFFRFYHKINVTCIVNISKK